MFWRTLAKIRVGVEENTEEKDEEDDDEDSVSELPSDHTRALGLGLLVLALTGTEGKGGVFASVGLGFCTDRSSVRISVLCLPTGYRSERSDRESSTK